MPSLFTITVATNTVLLTADRKGSASFTVSNISGRPVRGRARLVPIGETAASWLAIDGESERDFGIATTQEFKALVTVPVAAKPGSYSFRLDMAGVNNPDEDYTQGPEVVFEAKEVKPPPPPPRWPIIAAVIAAVVIVGAVIAFLVTRSNAQTAAQATMTAIAAATQTSIAQATATADAAATATAQVATQTAVAQKTATAIAAATQTASARGTATAQAIGTATAAAATQTAAVQATQTAQVVATQTAIAVAASKYNGTWSKEANQNAGIARFEISSSGPTITIEPFGDFREIVTSGGLVASQPCPTPCSWGQVNVNFTRDPLTFQVFFGPSRQVVHQITLTLLPDNRMSAVDVTRINNGSPFTRSLTYKRPPRVIFPFPTRFLQLLTPQP